MKYYFISDVHGCYDKMIKALNDAGFNAETDTLVSLGDPFDRGPQSYEVLEYLMQCPNRILVWGNHDYRLRNLLLGLGRPHQNDYVNGVRETMQSFCNNKNITNITLGITIFNHDANLKIRNKLLWQYFDECVWAIEFKDFVATHGWLPIDVDYDTYNDTETNTIRYLEIIRYWEDWQNAGVEDWYNASWANTRKNILNGAFHPEKKLLIGHWHAFRLRYFYENVDIKKEKYIDFSIYETSNYIAIDGCSNVNCGVVNVYVYETDETPKVYNPR